ncbi:MAG: T9SS type A sorting domain-containing protein [Bacteroidetes bacterium]|nr:T9SS type A sorting domain-containing protein [Bacteroidota bacterium]
MKTGTHKLFVYSLFLFILIFDQSIFGQTYNMTSGTINTCSGTFYDPGGGANYGNNLNITETFCSNSSNCLQVTFSSFNTQAGNDVLTIYDGPNTSSPVIGSFSGNTSPGTITSTSGCLTFQFRTNGSTQRAGWIANISCVSCGTTFLMNNNTAVSTCSGLFYDSGGAAGNYGNNQNFTKTFCSNAGTCIQMQFTTLDLRANDILTIYDGPNVASPLLSTITGSTIPPILLASSGCLTVNFTSNGSSNATGWQAAISCEKCPTPPAGVATYTHPTIGLQNTYVGTNMVSTCGGTYTDNGGLGGQYSNNINSVYRTFCPDQAGNCLRATFGSFDLQGLSGPFLTEYMMILNGPTQGSPEFGTGSTWFGTASTYQACLAAGLGPYTSTDQSGCLTFVFNSDATTTKAGWTITLDCLPCAIGPNGTDNSDCRMPTAVCGNATINDASTGPGIVSDGGGGCVLAENFSNWYKIIIASSGTLGLTITPIVTADDYDFALYAASSCGALGSPVRCSYAANIGNTGLNSATNLTTNTLTCGVANNGSDVSEDVCGNGWVDELPVIAGQSYYLLVNKWSAGGSGFSLNWNLTAGASLNCIVLPVELLSFDAKPVDDNVILNWSTASEINNNYFEVEKSNDGKEFKTFQFVSGAGNSTIQNDYSTVDESPSPGINYYRLKQVDFDGTIAYSPIVAVEINSSNVFYVTPNPAIDKLELVYSSSGKENLQLTIYNMQGNPVSNELIRSEKGLNRHELSIADLAKGIYYIVLKSQFTCLKTRFVKL